jgi:hypothetical protein
MSRKRRKIRKVRTQGVTVELLGREDFERLARRWSLDELAGAAREQAAPGGTASV